MKTPWEILARDGWQVVSVQGDMVEMVRPWPPEPGIHPSWMMVPAGMEEAAAKLLADEPVIVESAEARRV